VTEPTIKLIEGEVKRLVIGDQDKIVISCKDRLSSEEQHRIAKVASDFFAPVDVVIMDGCMDFTVVRDLEISKGESDGGSGDG